MPDTTAVPAVLGEERLREIEARVNAATAGPMLPYRAPAGGIPAAACDYAVVSEDTGLENARVWAEVDARFYAAVHQDIPDLLASHRALAQQVEWFIAKAMGHDERVTELLNANNAEVERRRKAEREAERLTLGMVAQGDKLLRWEAEESRKLKRLDDLTEKLVAAEAKSSALEERVAALESVLREARGVIDTELKSNLASVCLFADGQPDRTTMDADSEEYIAPMEAALRVIDAALSPQPSPQGGGMAGSAPSLIVLGSSLPQPVDALAGELADAIQHADDVGNGCGTCAAEHRQLAAWLRELVERRAGLLPATPSEGVSDA